MLYKNTPIGKIEIPSWEEKELINLSDKELLQKAVGQNKHFCISPSVFAMVEKRQLGRELQHLINSNVGMSHLTLDMISKW